MTEQKSPTLRAIMGIEKMKLPEGKTCGDCVHCRLCHTIFGRIPEDQVCDWRPSRFREKEAEQ